MNRKQKIDFINKVNDFFINAKNHGNNGDNWWYPKENVIAYNVKLYGGNKSIEDIRKLLSKRQNEYYSDSTLYEIMQDQQNDQAIMFSNELDEAYNVKSGYAGRSGGWLEVEYNNDLIELEENTDEDVNYYYKLAKELCNLEMKVSNHIEKSLSSYKKYINTDQYCADIVDILIDDEMIGDIYKNEAKSLLDKLN